VFDEDWRGIDREWLRRLSEDLFARMDEAGGPEAAFLSRDPGVDGAFAEFRRFDDATRTRTRRYIQRRTDAWMRPCRDDFAPRALVDELGGVGHRPWQDLSVTELMEEFRGAEDRGVAIIRTLLRLGFVRLHYPGLEETHRYYCRAADDRAALREQFLRWLRSRP
jgi:hypothetical protein